MTRSGWKPLSLSLASWRRIAARCALLALLAVLGSCKASPSVAHGSRIVLGLGMTLAEVKASCPDHLELFRAPDANDVFTSPGVLRTVVIRGLGQDIELRDSTTLFSIRNNRVEFISVDGVIGAVDRKSAEALFEGFGERLVPKGWFPYPERSPQHKVYGRDEHPATVNIDVVDMTGTSEAKERDKTGECWGIRLGMSDISNGK